MKRLILLFLILLPSVANAQTLLAGPQKIAIDAKRNRLLVSNYNDGSLVQIDSTGTQRYFVKDADFIDGIEIVGDSVYGVGTDRHIRVYNLETGQLVKDIIFPGDPSDYLSSIAHDSTGNLFISCPGLNTIYRLRISDWSYWVFAENNGLNRPNGILLERERNRIIVIDDSQGGSIIHSISLADSTVSTLAITSFNSPDGITRDINGYYYVGGYYLPGVYRIDPGFSKVPELFFEGTTIVYPTYDQSDNSLLVTFYGNDSWKRIPLTKNIKNH